MSKRGLRQVGTSRSDFTITSVPIPSVVDMHRSKSMFAFPSTNAVVSADADENTQRPPQSRLQHLFPSIQAINSLQVDDSPHKMNQIDTVNLSHQLPSLNNIRNHGSEQVFNPRSVLPIQRHIINPLTSAGVMQAPVVPMNDFYHLQSQFEGLYAHAENMFDFIEFQKVIIQLQSRMIERYRSHVDDQDEGKADGNDGDEPLKRTNSGCADIDELNREDIRITVLQHTPMLHNLVSPARSYDDDQSVLIKKQEVVKEDPLPIVTQQSDVSTLLESSSNASQPSVTPTLSVPVDADSTVMQQVLAPSLHMPDGKPKHKRGRPKKEESSERAVDRAKARSKQSLGERQAELRKQEEEVSAQIFQLQLLQQSLTAPPLQSVSVPNVSMEITARKLQEQHQKQQSMLQMNHYSLLKQQHDQHLQQHMLLFPNKPFNFQAPIPPASSTQH